MNVITAPGQLAAGPGDKGLALSFAVPLWAVTALSFGYLCWLFAKALGAFAVIALAGMFGISLERLAGHLRFDAALLMTAALAVSTAACGLAYCFPAMRALPGTHQCAVLGALAFGAPLAAAVRAATR